MLGPARDTSIFQYDIAQVQDDSDDPSSVANNFFMYIFKVQPCPKRGAHDWSSCPYAHPKEKARRRDPRVYKYASTPCPESLKGVSCGRGVECPYAHSVYEYWLHPSRFRTQMCKKGNQCNRTLCFFAHSASELRFPDTSDDLEAAAVDAAAASATAGALPLCTSNSQVFTPPPGVVMMQQGSCTNNNSNSSYGPLQGIMALNQVCTDSNMQLANNGCGSYASQGSYSLVKMGSGVQQLMRQEDAAGYGLGGSDPGLRMPGVAVQTPDAHSLSDPLPRLGSDAMMACTPGSSAWLQLAAASQLPASQILSSIKPPAAQQLQQQQAARLMPAAGAPAGAYAPSPAAAASMAQQQHRAHEAALHRMSAPPGMFMLNTTQPMESADRLTSGLSSMNLVDDSSGSSCLTAISGDQQYLVALNACAAAAAAGRPVDLGMLHQGLASPPPKGSDFMLLHQLQQQQQLIKLGSGSSTGSCSVAASGRQSSGGMTYLGMPPGVAAVQQAAGSWVRMA